MIWTVASIFSGVAVVACIFGWAVLHGYRINAQLDELIEERKAAREEARRIAREREEEERRLAAE